MAKKLYVGNISYAVDQDALQALFAPFGAVQSVKLITDNQTGRSKGYGFVEMTNDEEAAKAIADLNGKEVEGRVLRVDEAKPQEGGGGGRRGGGGGRGGYGGGGGGRGGYGGGGGGGRGGYGGGGGGGRGGYGGGGNRY